MKLTTFYTLGGVTAAALLAGIWFVAQPEGQADAVPDLDSIPQGAPLVQVAVPALSENAALGAQAFNGLCSGCHGENAAGRNGIGPPLIHVIYEPNHHGDMAFYMAAQNGVKSHHWPFGDMPPVAGVTQADVTLILAYIREVQAANGIF